MMAMRQIILSLVLIGALAGNGQGVPLPEPPPKPKSDGKPTALSPDGSTLARADGDIIAISDTRNKVPVVRAKLKTRGTIRALAFSPDGKILASGDDQTLSFYAPASGEMILTLHHGKPTQELKFSPDGTHIVITCVDGRKVTVDARNGAVMRVSK